MRFLLTNTPYIWRSYQSEPIEAKIFMNSLEICAYAGMESLLTTTRDHIDKNGGTVLAVPVEINGA